jgi:hypothetical protein
MEASDTLWEFIKQLCQQYVAEREAIKRAAVQEAEKIISQS